VEGSDPFQAKRAEAVKEHESNAVPKGQKGPTHRHGDVGNLVLALPRLALPIYISNLSNCADDVYEALLRIGWKPPAQEKPGSHKQLTHDNFGYSYGGS